MNELSATGAQRAAGAAHVRRASARGLPISRHMLFESSRRAVAFERRPALKHVRDRRIHHEDYEVKTGNSFPNILRGLRALRGCVYETDVDPGA